MDLIPRAWPGRCSSSTESRQALGPWFGSGEAAQGQDYLLLNLVAITVSSNDMRLNGLGQGLQWSLRCPGAQGPGAMCEHETCAGI